VKNTVFLMFSCLAVNRPDSSQNYLRSECDRAMLDLQDIKNTNKENIEVYLCI